MIVPQPAQIIVREGFLKELSDTEISASDSTPMAVEAMRLITDLGIKIALHFDHDPEIPPEGYRLEVTTEQVNVTSATPDGMYYGVQTLVQLVKTRDQVPCLTIEDAPRFRWRGLMLDSSRHFHSLDRVRRILDQMAALKMNVLHWHLTDDQGWRIQIMRYPLLTKIGARRHPDEPEGSGYYTQAELKSLVRYAHERGITVVPEIEIPAHTSAAMAAYPELTCSGEAVEVTGIGVRTFNLHSGKLIYCPANPRVMPFIRDVLDEVMEVFDSPVIHIGGDERPEGIWSECPNCQALMAREGIESEEALQRWLLGQVADYVNSKGRRTMAWTPTVEFGVPKDQIVQDWYFGVIPAAVALGAEVVNSHDRFTYFDYPNFPGRQKPKWMPDLPLERVYEFEPVPEEVDERSVLGSECSLWTEFLEDEDIDIALFPRMLAFAEVVWSPAETRSFPSFEERIVPLESFLGVTYATSENEKAGQIPSGQRVETTMLAVESYPAECAVNGKFTRFFWTQDPPQPGDAWTWYLPHPLQADSIKVFTGSDMEIDHELVAGSLEVSDDGQTFFFVGPVSGSRTELRFPAQPVAAVKIVVEQEQENRLAIREVVVGRRDEIG